MFSSKIIVGVVQLTLDDLVNTCHFGSSFNGRPNMVQKAVQPLSHAWETHKLPCRSYKDPYRFAFVYHVTLAILEELEGTSVRKRGKPED